MLILRMVALKTRALVCGETFLQLKKGLKSYVGPVRFVTNGLNLFTPIVFSFKDNSQVFGGVAPLVLMVADD